jgi:hypothetical protein
LNPYNTCVTNKEVNGSRYTLIWYVDDTRISHADEVVLSEVVCAIVIVTRGKVHNFLGMDIQFNDNGTADVKMKTYIKDTIST